MAVSRKTNDVPKGVNLSYLPEFCKEIGAAKQKMADQSMAHAGIYQRAESLGYHKKALKDAVSLYNQEPTKRVEYLTALNTYLDILKVNAQGDLFDKSPGQVRVGEAEPPGGNEEPPLPLGADEAALKEIEDVGYRDGLAGRDGRNEYAPDSPHKDSYITGWLKGQEELAGGRPKASERAPAGEGAATRNRKRRTATLETESAGDGGTAGQRAPAVH